MQKTHLEEIWITALTELLRAARSLHPRCADSEYAAGQADLIARAVGLIPGTSRPDNGSAYLDVIKAAITGGDTVPRAVRTIETMRRQS